MKTAATSSGAEIAGDDFLDVEAAAAATGEEPAFLLAMEQRGQLPALQWRKRFVRGAWRWRRVWRRGSLEIAVLTWRASTRHWAAAAIPPPTRKRPARRLERRNGRLDEGLYSVPYQRRLHQRHPT